MNLFRAFHSALTEAIRPLVPEGADLSKVTVEPPREETHGDMATNAAMVLAKTAGKNPRALAEDWKPVLEKLPYVTGVDIAGPGFINFRLDNAALTEIVTHILDEGVSYGDSDIGQDVKVNVEYVSANPTGPMHAGHVRGAVIGDALCNVMEKAGFDVTREYYFNDAGKQIEVLAQTAYLRYREANGENIGTIPEGLYPGDYMKEVGNALKEKFADKYMKAPESEWYEPIKDASVAFIMAMIREDLALIGIRHKVFSNEREMVESGKLQAAFDALQAKGLIYQGMLPPPKGKEMEDWEPAELTLFRSSDFGDQSDRPLKKRDGTWAYIMPDIAYHHDKISRGFEIMINVLGADHSGYLERMRPAIAALGSGKAQLDVIINQMVKILKNGEPVKLSKRSGNIITLREMVEEVGAGVVRFFMLTRTPDSHLEFDYAKVVEQSADNPVFYVQYAHARCASVLRHAATMFGDVDAKKADLSVLKDPAEIAVMKRIALWPRVVEQAALSREPHKIAFYLMDLAASFHSLWNKGRDNAELRFLVESDKEGSLARIALVRALKTTIASALGVMGVQPVEEMKSDDLNTGEAA